MEIEDKDWSKEKFIPLKDIDKPVKKEPEKFLRPMFEYIKDKSSKNLEILIWEIGPASGVHIGPGFLGLSWIGPAAEDLLK